MKFFITILSWLLIFTPVANGLNVYGELKAAQLEKLGTPPTGSEGRVYFNTTSGTAQIYNGTSWVDIGSGSGGSGGINYLSEEKDAQKGVSNWICSGGSLSVSQETTVGNIPMYPAAETAIKLSQNSGTIGHYCAIRFSVPKGAKVLSGIEWRQLTSAGYADGDLELQLFENDASDYTGSFTEVNHRNIDDTSGDALIAAGGSPYISDFMPTEQLTAVGYYELRFAIKISSATSDLFLNELKITPERQGSGAAGGWKIYDENVVTFSSTPPGWSLDGASFQPYKDHITGTWRMVFNISATMTSAISATVTIDGVTFAPFIQTLENAPGTATTLGRAFANASSGVISLNYASNDGNFIVSGDVALGGKPTWADSDSTVNLLNNQNVIGNAKFVALGLTSTPGTTSGADKIISEWNTPTISGGGSFDGTDYTIPSDGTYRIRAKVTLNSLAVPTSDVFRVRVLKNTSTVVTDNDQPIYAATDFPSRVVTYEGPFVKGDTIRIDTRQDSGASPNIRATNDATQFSVSRVADDSTPSAKGFTKADANNYGLSLKNKIQTKETTANIFSTGVITSLTFNNLVIGRLYKAEINAFMGKTSETLENVNIRIDIENNSVSQGFMQILAQTGTDAFRHSSSHYGFAYFIATSTTVQFNITTMTGGNSYISTGSYATLTELNNGVLTTDFN